MGGERESRGKGKKKREREKGGAEWEVLAVDSPDGTVTNQSGQGMIIAISHPKETINGLAKDEID